MDTRNGMHTAAAFFLSSIFASSAMAEPTLTLECINPKMTAAKFNDIASGEASTVLIQFNINKGGGASNSTINVSKTGNNKGICTVTISDGYVIKSGDYFSSATGIHNESDPSKPEDLSEIVDVKWMKSGVRSGQFLVSALKESPIGNVTLSFSVKYKKDEE